MNEQLIVKNFGPIKDATVDFKRVTVFIGPTGGGKSTLAKLAAIFRQRILFTANTPKEQKGILDESLYNYEIDNYARSGILLNWKVEDEGKNDEIIANEETINILINLSPKSGSKEEYVTQKLQRLIEDSKIENGHELDAHEVYYFTQEFANEFDKSTIEWFSRRFPNVLYIPADRLFASAASKGLSRYGMQNSSLGKPILDFLEEFSTARRHTAKFSINFLNSTFESNGIDVKINGLDNTLYLHESASGIQSVAPMLSIILSKLYRNTISFRPDTFSFIIEEPELNLYPTAQQGLLNWLVEKCTKGENDLTITTHSPYILSHLNLLLYAYQVAEKHPDRAEEVAGLVPRASWINPTEFACCQVENGGVKSLVNDDLGLIDDNGLDNLSADAADAFDNLIRLAKGVARK